MNAQAPRLVDRTPWQPGKRFTILPSDVPLISIRFRVGVDREAILRHWQYMAEAIADHAIARMVRGGGVTK